MYICIAIYISIINHINVLAYVHLTCTEHCNTCSYDYVNFACICELPYVICSYTLHVHLNWYVHLVCASEHVHVNFASTSDFCMYISHIHVIVVTYAHVI